MMDKMDPPLLWTAIITPFLESEEVDYDSLKSLLKMQEAFGNGILTLGSTGEALNLDYEELVNILDFTLSQNLTVPIMCGVGGINLKETKKWIELLETKNIDAYLLVSPLYAKPGDEGQYEWFKELMNISSKPVMMYNVPSRTGSSLSLSAVKRLNKHPQFWAIKEASGSPETFAKYVEAAGPGKVYSGDDAMCPSYAAIGCKGLVSVCANIWPKETQRYISDCLEGKLGDQETMWAESANSLFMASNPIPAKALMSELGMISTPILRAPLTHKEKIDGAKLMKSHLNITEWFLSK